MRKRIAPLEPDQWSDATRVTFGGTLEKVAEMEGRSGSAGAPARPKPEEPKPLNILRTIAHHPRLLQPFLGFAATLAIGGVLSRRDSELLALRTARNCRSAFEWGHHVLYAREAGLSDAEITHIGASAAGDPCWSASDAALLRAADELHDGHDVTQATWDALAERFDEAQLVEITFIVGNYTMLSMVANATGVPLEADLPALPDGETEVRA